MSWEETEEIVTLGQLPGSCTDALPPGQYDVIVQIGDAIGEGQATVADQGPSEVVVDIAIATAEMLRLSAESVPAGSTVSLTWGFAGQPEDGVFISPLDLADNRYPLDDDLRHLAREGQPAELVAPAEPGTYELRYFSPAVGRDEDGALRSLKGHLAALEPVVGLGGGRIDKFTGDGFLAEFLCVVAAVSAATMQRQLAERNAAQPEALRMAFHMGVHVGDVVVDGDDILGDGVNVAAACGRSRRRGHRLGPGARARGGHAGPRLRGLGRAAAEAAPRPQPWPHRQPRPRTTRSRARHRTRQPGAGLRCPAGRGCLGMTARRGAGTASGTAGCGVAADD